MASPPPPLPSSFVIRYVQGELSYVTREPYTNLYDAMNVKGKEGEGIFRINQNPASTPLFKWDEEREEWV